MRQLRDVEKRNSHEHSCGVKQCRRPDEVMVVLMAKTEA